MMLQYFTNATAIWLISLVVFDAFMRRQTFHSYNRFYLLLTFASGILLPLWQRVPGIDLEHTDMAMPVTQVINAHQHIQAATNAVTPAAGLPWLAATYIAGLVVAAGILLADIVKLAIYYKRGRKSAQGGWTIVETHKEHAPFSFFNLLFIGSRKLYNEEEWSMLLVHEQQHRSLVHFADLLLMQLSRVVFWFHPLVYIYNNRLCMLHEYQADNAAEQPLPVYGRFLVEQALLRSTPSVSHALSSSPVKSRILMLKRKPASYRLPSQLLVVPLIALFIICFTKYDIEYQSAQTTGRTQLTSTSYVPDYAGYGQGVATTIAQETDYAKTAKGTTYKTYDNGRQGAYSSPERHYTHGNGSVIMLAGMENNNNAKCCSANLLWGTSYTNAPISGSVTRYEQVYMPEYAANPCAPGFDAHRKDQYVAAMESYRHIQASWEEYQQDNNTQTAWETATAKATQLLVMDDPWSNHTDRSPGMVPPLSIDKSVFGATSRSIFDGVATKEKTEPSAMRDWLASAAGDSKAPKIKINKTSPIVKTYN